MGRSESNKVNTLFFDFFFENADIYYKTFSVPFQLSFQDSATPVMNGLLDLHDYIFFFLIVIISVVIVLLVKVRFTFVLNNNEGFDLNIFTDYTFATPYNRLVGLSFLSFFFKMLPKIISNLVLWILQLLKNFLFFFFFFNIKYCVVFIKKIGRRDAVSKIESNHFVVKTIELETSNSFSSRIYTKIGKLRGYLAFSLYRIKAYFGKNGITNLLSFSLKYSNVYKKIFLKDSIIKFEKFFHDEFFKNKNFSFGNKLFDFFFLNSISKETLNLLKKKFKDDSSILFIDKKIKSDNLRKNYFFEGDIKNIFLSKKQNKVVTLNEDEFSTLFCFLFTKEIDKDKFGLVKVETDRGYSFFEDIKSDNLIYSPLDLIRGSQLDIVFGFNEKMTSEACPANYVETSNSYFFSKNSLNKDLFFTKKKLKKSAMYFDDELFAQVFEENLILNIFASKYYQRLNFLISYLSLLFNFKLIKFFSSFISRDIIKKILKKNKNLSKQGSLLFKEDFQKNSPYVIKNIGTSLFGENNKDLIGSRFSRFVFFAIGDFYINNTLSAKIIQLQSLLKISQFNHSTRLEIIWTIIPVLIIGLIITPSFFLMYAIDEDIESLLTIKVIGHQWYWSYTYEVPVTAIFLSLNTEGIDNNVFGLDVKSLTKFGDSSLISMEDNDNDCLQKVSFSFDSYMLDGVTDGSPRLLSTDQILVLPKYSHINCIVTSTDVIHSWALPSLGVKIDAVPGRLNRVDVFLEHEGMFFGQCSELCGVNHSFMPIQMESVHLSKFLEKFL